uniref:Uncharacterized protein n=1 Tax=Anguilla anguilla TaxID=7936 RepID=A0A0E9QYD4_ANGAN
MDLEASYACFITWVSNSSSGGTVCKAVHRSLPLIRPPK